MPISPEEFRRAELWVENNRKTLAQGVEFDGRRLVLTLFDRVEPVFVDPREINELRHATDRELREVELSPMGDTMHFESLDVDIYVPALVQ